MRKLIFEHYKVEYNEATIRYYKIIKNNIKNGNTACYNISCPDCTLRTPSSCLYIELRNELKYARMHSQEVYKIIIDELKKIYEKNDFKQEEMDV